jgi:hypothetical protein
MNHNDKRKRTYVLLIAACFGLSLFCLVYPIYVIRPFRHQGVRELAAALVILRFRLVAMALCTVIALLAATLYWRVQPQTLRRIVAALGVTAVCLFTGLSRVNIYELMFHPMGRPAFVPAAETNLDGDEKVIAIEVGGSARAYPIRIISYHHIVNDVVGGVSIVATY